MTSTTQESLAGTARRRIPAWGRVPQAILLVLPVLAFAWLAWNSRK